MVLGVGGVAAHSFSGLHPDSEEFGPHKHKRRVAAVTGACMAMKRAAFDLVGGFDEQNLPVDFNDIDICLKLAERGLRTLFTPHVTLIHHESKTRASQKENSWQARRFKQEIQWMQLRWFNTLFRDPYYNSNFSLEIPGHKLAWPPRTKATPDCSIATRNLDMYATENNPKRAMEVVRYLAKDSSSISSLKTEIADRLPGLSIVILNLDKPEFIIPLVESLLPANDYFNGLGLGLEILIGDTGTSDSKVLALYRSAPDFVRVVDGLDYQFSRCNNQVFALESQYDTVLFLNNDIAFEGSAAESLFKLYQFLDTTPDAGTVGAQLLFPEGNVQHAGIGVFESGELRCFVYHPDSKMPPLDEAEFPRKMWAVTGACLMIKASDFVSVGGFDEGYRTECQDAALCLEIHRRGKRSYVLSPNVIYHFENGTRDKGSEDWADRQRFMRHWSAWIESNLMEGGP